MPTDAVQVDLDVARVRHVQTDFDGMHLVAHDDAQYALCGDAAGGLRKFGHPADDPETAAKLATFVNVRDDMCPHCRQVFNFARFD